jgi:hypothetical protein
MCVGDNEHAREPSPRTVRKGMGGGGRLKGGTCSLASINIPTYKEILRCTLRNTLPRKETGAQKILTNTDWLREKSRPD